MPIFTAQSFRERLILFFTLSSLVSILFIIVPCVLAEQPSPSEKAEMLYRMKKGIDYQKAKIKEVKEKEDTITSELEEIDAQLRSGQKKLITTQEMLLKHEGYIREKEHEINLIEGEKAKIEVHIKNRLRAFYQTGEVGIINTLFSARTLPELLNTQEYFHAIFEYDQEVIKQFRTKISLLENAQKEILQEKENLLALIIDVKDQEQKLIGIRQERAQLLQKVHEEEKLYRQALTEIQQSAANLAKTFKSLERRIIRQDKSKVALKEGKAQQKSRNLEPFLEAKGHLAPPLSGRILQKFGKSKGKFGTTIQSNGIQIEVLAESEVRAVFDGEVMYTGSLKGYDNLVILDHGDQYFSLVSNLDRITAEKGDLVSTGEPLGIIAPKEQGLFHSGLHFEIRHESEPLNPLQWLKTNTMLE